MTNINMRRCVLLMAVCLLCIAVSASERKVCIDDGWAFRLGNIVEAVRADYDDTDWRRLCVPHDWSVEQDAAMMHTSERVGPFVKDAIGTHQTGCMVGGEGWYRRHIALTKEDLKGAVALYFEGVYNQSRVYVNGREVGFNPYGYQGFCYDITRECHAGNNVIAVQALNVGNNTRWYAGSGIFRHVWLVRTPPTHLVAWDTYTQCERRGAVCDVTVRTSWQGKAKGQTMLIDICDAEGKSVARYSGAPKEETHFTIDNPRMWHPDKPYLYSLSVTLTARDGQSDCVQQAFGLRTIEVSAERGLLINGEPLLLRGGCVHHDHGLLGAASHDDAEARKVRLLKAQGFNAVRCSHNLQSEAFLDECDRQGMVVIDECFDQWETPDGKNADDYHQYFKTWSERDITTMVRRDRRHPSVCFWSLGNEIPERAEPSGVAIAKRLRAMVLSLDKTRPITAAIATWGRGANDWERDVQVAFQSLDVAGYNYNWQRYESDHANAPQRVMMGTESFPADAARNWQQVERLPYVIGDFVWTAMDYLGEAGIGHVVRAGEPNPMFMPWPWFNAWCGDIDLIGQKKPQSYYRDVLWRRTPIAMLASEQREEPDQVSGWGWPEEYASWTFPSAKRHAPMTVRVFARSPQVRLYLNGQLIGNKKVDDTYTATFAVPYVPGSLRAVEWDGHKEGAETWLLSGGGVMGLRLTADVPSQPDQTATVKRGGLVYVTIELVNADNRPYPDSQSQLRFALRGPATLLAAGNACPTDQQSFRSLSPRLYRGQALTILKAGDTAGRVEFSVEVPGFMPRTMSINVE